MNEFEAYNMQNRANLAQIWQMLARNMQLMGSNNVPFIGSTYVMPMSYAAPNMFSQIQGVLSDLAGEEIGGIFGMLGNPAIRGMLPNMIADPLNAMMRNAPIGGTLDPAAFMFSQINAQQGRAVPRVTMPTNFQNRYSVDLYNEQQRQFANFMGELGVQDLDTFEPLAALPEATPQNENLIRAKAFQNVLSFRNQNRGFDNAFALFNELDIFGPRLADNFVSSDDYRTLQQIDTEGQARQLFSNTNLQKIADSAIQRANLASGLISGAQMLASMTGGNPFQNAEMQGIGNLLTDVLQLNENPTAFALQGAQALGGIGNLGLSTLDNGQGQGPQLVSNILTAALSNNIQAKDSISGFNPYSSLQRAGLGRSAELITELGRSGMLTTGGVDVFGNMQQEDIKKMEEALLTQLEGFTEITKVGKRMGLKTQEVIQNLQSITGGRANEMLGQAADTALNEITSIRSDGTVEADILIARENERRIAAGNEELTSQQRTDFLRMEAQRRGGSELMQQFEKLVETGRMAGLDTRGSLAAATTGAQVLQSLGMNTMGGLNLAQEALGLVAQSRNTGGTPLTVAEGFTVAATKQQKQTQNAEQRAFAALLTAVKDGVLDKNDSRVQELIAQGQTGTLSLSAVDSALRNIAGLEDVSPYMSDAAIMNSFGENREELSKAADRNMNMNVSGRILNAFRQAGLSSDSAQMTTIMEAAKANNNLGLAADATELNLVARLLTMDEPARNAAIDSLALDAPTKNKLAASLRQIQTMKIDGMDFGAGNKGMMALFMRELEVAQYGTTKSEIAAEADSELRATLAKTLDIGNSGDSLVAGIRSVRDAKVKEEAERLMRESPEFQGIHPNEEALAAAEALVNEDPANDKLSDQERKAKINAEASKLATSQPSKYGVLVPNQEALDIAEVQIAKKINDIAKSFEGRSLDTLTPEQQKAVFSARALEYLGLNEQFSETIIDPKAAIPDQDAAAQAVMAEGVNLDSLSDDIFKGIEDNSALTALQTIRAEATKELETALTEAGIEPAVAFDIAQRANMSFEDLQERINKSNLAKEEKTDLLDRLDDYKQSRIQAKQQGEITVNDKGEAVTARIVVPEDASTLVDELRAKGNATLDAEDAKAAATADVDMEAELQTELKMLQQDRPELFDSRQNIKAYEQAVKNLAAKGSSFTDILKAAAGDIDGRLQEALPGLLADVETELDSLNSDAQLTPAERGRREKLERQKRIMMAYQDSFSSNSSIAQRAQKEIANLEANEKAEQERLAAEKKAIEDKATATSPPNANTNSVPPTGSATPPTGSATPTTGPAAPVATATGVNTPAITTSQATITAQAVTVNVPGSTAVPNNYVEQDVPGLVNVQASAAVNSNATAESRPSASSAPTDVTAKALTVNMDENLKIVLKTIEGMTAAMMQSLASIEAAVRMRLN